MLTLKTNFFNFFAYQKEGHSTINHRIADPITRIQDWITRLPEASSDCKTLTTLFLYHIPQTTSPIYIIPSDFPWFGGGHSSWGTSMLCSPLSQLRNNTIFLLPPNSVSIIFYSTSVGRESQDYGGNIQVPSPYFALCISPLGCAWVIYYFFHIFPFLIYLFIYWRIIVLQNFAVVKPHHESAIGIHISPPFWTYLPSPFPFHSRLIQSPCLSFLSLTVNSCWLSILHIIM